jgi:predicted GIY-YIG superfamily endonuclease
VYGIIDPRTNALFYIGQTGAFARRKAEHLEGTDQISGLVIRQIMEAGFLPHFVGLERHDTEETALRAEIFWIELLLSRGIELVNAQAFDGFLDRQSKRQSETQKLADMQQLRALANGRTLTRSRPKPTKPISAKASSPKPSSARASAGTKIQASPKSRPRPRPPAAGRP